MIKNLYCLSIQFYSQNLLCPCFLSTCISISPFSLMRVGLVCIQFVIVSVLLSCLRWPFGLTRALQRCEGEQLWMSLRNFCTLLDSLGSFQFSQMFQFSALFLFSPHHSARLHFPSSEYTQKVISWNTSD